MTEETQLIKAREQIKLRIDRGEYRSLAVIILDNAGRPIQTLTQMLSHRSGPLSPLYNSGIVALTSMLIGLGVSLLLGEHLSFGEWQILVWAAVTGSLILIANQITIRMFLDTLRESVLDHIGSLADLENIQSWLDTNFDPKRPLIFGLSFGPLLGILLITVWGANNHETVHIGILVTAMLASFQAVVVTYYLFPFYVSLPIRLSKYRFKLFVLDPSSSEVVNRLSDLLTNIMYITVAYVSFIILSLGYFRLLTWSTSLFVAVMVWLPAVALYAGGQSNLSKIIARAKWETLNEIQAKIEKLHAEEHVPTRDTLDHLEKLIAFHDQIQNTPNSAITVRASLHYLNAILLPALAFVLSNLNLVSKFFDLFQQRSPSP